MSAYYILDENKNIINCINADYDFVSSNFQFFEEATPFYNLNEDAKARIWRDEELKNTDWVVPITDHPQHATYLTYRQALRDWPSTPEFPNTKPEM